MESRVSVRTFIENAELKRIEWTRSDRQCVELTGRLTSGLGPDTIAIHRRIITRLDRHLVWDVDLADSSYTQSAFPNMELAAVEAEMLAVETKGGFAPPPSPVATLGPRADLGAGDRICGLATTIARRRDRIAPPAPASGPVSTRLVNWWETRDLPGLDLAVSYEAARQALGDKPGPGGSLDRRSSDVAGFTDICGPFVVGHSGYPMRVVAGFEMPASKLAELRDSLATTGVADPRLAAMGFDLENRTSMTSRMEVVGCKLVDIPDDRFELPPGLKRKPSEAEGLRQLLDLGRAPDAAPGPRK